MAGSVQALGGEIVRLAADMEAAMCRWLELVAEFDDRRGWHEEGCKNCAAWVAWRCGIGGEAARERVRVARRLREMPLVRAAFSRSELTYSKVRALTRIDDLGEEARMVELARNHTAEQLERVVSAYRGVLRREEDAEQSHESRFFDWSTDSDDGSVRFRGKLPADQAAIVIKALEAARDQQAADVSAETQTPVWAESTSTRNADALVELAESGLSGLASASSSGGDRFQVVLHVDHAALHGAADGRAELDDGAPLSTETVKRLCCDAAVVPIVERNGQPLSIGRKTRSIPSAMRRALRARDGGCQFPGCERTRHTDAHHIEHWAHGGETKLTNLVTLCRFHHRLLHEGGYTVGRELDRLVFTAPDGHRLSPAPRLRIGDADRLRSVSAETEIQPMLERMNLGLSVDAVITITGVPD